MRFTSKQRLRRTAEYAAVRSDGFRINCGTFFLNFLSRENEIGPPVRRLGVIASRRVGDAVRRNRAKRRLREIFRLNQEQLPFACDIVLIARRSLIDESYRETEERFLKACRRIQVRRQKQLRNDP